MDTKIRAVHTMQSRYDMDTYYELVVHDVCTS